MARRPPPPLERTFSVEEVGEVIRTASALSHQDSTQLPAPVREGLRFPELLEVARELGVPEDLLRRAIPEADQQRRRAEKRTRKLMRFWRHLSAYGITVGGLTLVDAVSGPDWWVGIPATLWGILVALHGTRTFFTGKDGRLHKAVYEKALEEERRAG